LSKKIKKKKKKERKKKRKETNKQTVINSYWLPQLALICHTAAASKGLSVTQRNDGIGLGDTYLKKQIS